LSRLNALVRFGPSFERGQWIWIVVVSNLSVNNVAGWHNEDCWSKADQVEQRAAIRASEF
jgi:hypothetical protein